jgi:hypothetical protein
MIQSAATPPRAVANLFRVTSMWRSVTVLALLAFVVSGCAISKDKAIEIATKEVRSRKLPLPKTYAVAIRESRSHDDSFAPDYWQIRFGWPDVINNPSYELLVRQYGGGIDQFTDYRKKSSRGEKQR